LVAPGSSVAPSSLSRALVGTSRKGSGMPHPLLKRGLRLLLSWLLRLRTLQSRHQLW